MIGLKTGTTDQYQGTYLGYNDYGQRTSETSYRLELVGKRGSQVVSPSTPTTPGTETGGGPNPSNESGGVGGAGSTPVAGWILNNQWVQSTVRYDYNADGQVVQGTLDNTLGENYQEGQFVAGDAALQATNARVLKVDYDQYGRIYHQESADQFGKLIAGAQLRQVVDTTYVDKTQQIDSSSVSNSSVNPDKATDGIKHSSQKSQYEYESFGNVKQVVTDITGEQSFQSITRYNYLAGSGQASSIVSSRSGASGEGITTVQFDGNGQVRGSTDSLDGKQNTSNTLDANGHIWQQSRDGKVQRYFYVLDQQVGDSNSGVKKAVITSVNTVSTPGREGTTTSTTVGSNNQPGAVSNFELTYQPISQVGLLAQGSAAGKYAVQAGDTLRSIAQSQ